MIIQEPVLLIRPTQDIEKDEIADVSEKVIAEMRSIGGSSLSAPAIGILKKLFVYDPKDDTGIMIACNPVFRPEEGDVIQVEESCPCWDQRYVMMRYSRIQATYYDKTFTQVTRIMSDVEAINFQHECDHLSGKHPHRGAIVNQNGKYVEVVKSISFPRNSSCPCGTGKKFKKCCGRLVHG